MKVVHWTLTNGSGLHHMARDISQAEAKLGVDSTLMEATNPVHAIKGADADIHVIHSHIPDKVKAVAKKLVYVVHGTPEHSFQSSVEAGLNQGYGAGDSWMMMQHYLQVSDAIVTWWPRHQAILQSLCDKKTTVTLVPMGVDRTVWKPQETRGRWAGSPSLLTAENCHYIKWPLDLFILWPWVSRQIPDAVLHAHYLPRDQHRWFMTLVNRNGASYKSYLSATPLAQPDLINAFCSTDFFIGLVRYGDYNRLSMEARACGAKVISYSGNEYADYWIPEGDQRVMAEHLVKILKGETEPRQNLPEVPDISDTAARMKEIYESL